MGSSPKPVVDFRSG